MSNSMYTNMKSGKTGAMLDNVKARAATTKRAASGAVVAASSAMKQGISAVTDKSYAASLKMPLVADETAAAGPSTSTSRVETRAVKEKLAKAGSVLKVSVDRVKQKCDVAAAEAVGKLGTAKSTVKVGVGAVMDKCDAGIDVMMEKLNRLQARSGLSLNMLEFDCIDMLVSMGFAHKDALKAVQVFGPEDLNSIMDFLCQEPGQLASAPDWDARIAQCIARRMVQIQLDEEEDVEIALALSKFQAEASAANGCPLPEASPFAPFHCWEGSHSSDAHCTHVTGMLCARQNAVGDAEPKTVHLKPSVGTWMLPLPKHCKEAPSATFQDDSIQLSVDTEQSVPVFTGDLLALSADEEQKTAEVSSLVSSRQGAVCCGA